MLQKFFNQLDGMIDQNGSVKPSFVTAMQEKVRSQINSYGNLTNDFENQLDCLFATLTYQQRAEVINDLFAQMQGSMVQNAKRTEIVLRLIETTPYAQFVQMKDLINANGFDYFEELCDLKIGGTGVAYNNSYVSSTVNEGNFSSYSLAQRKRAIIAIDKLIQASNAYIINDPLIYTENQTIVENVPLFTWGFLDVFGSTTESSYSTSGNGFTIDLVIDMPYPQSDINDQISLYPYEMVLVTVQEDFDQTIIRPDNGQPLKAGDRFLISSLHLHKIIKANDLIAHNAYLRFVIETGLFVATAGSSMILTGIEAAVIGTQMVLEHNNVNIQQMQDGPLKTTLLAIKDYGDFVVAGSVLLTRTIGGVNRLPYLNKTTQASGTVQYSFQNDEIGLALEDLRNSNNLPQNLTKVRALINSMDGYTDYSIRSVKKHLEAFELDTKFQQLSGNTSRHYVHFDVNSNIPHFCFVHIQNGTAHTKKSLFDVAFEADQIRLTNIDWLPTSTTGNISICARYSNVRYQKTQNGSFVTGNLEVVKNSSGQLYVRIPPFDVLLDALKVKFAGQSNVIAWLDEIPNTMITLLQKLDGLPNSYSSNLNTDLGSSSNGAAIKLLIEENPDDLLTIYTLLKDDPKYCFELAKTGGLRWEKWAQGNFFKSVTQAGKDFEELICKVAFSNRNSVKYLELKQKFQLDFGKNLDEYEMFSQVQLKYNSIGDYFVADQIFVKYGFDEFGAKYVEDVVVIENKLSSTTALSPNQTNAIQSNSYIVRSNSIESATSNGLFLTQDEILNYSDMQQWYKVYSSGNGDSILGIQKIN